MGRFSRSARWLDQLFTPSTAPPESPGVRSDDVQLTENYGGGGYPLVQSGEWFFSSGQITIASAGTNHTRLLGGDFETNANQLTRILSVGVEFSTFTATTQCQLLMRFPTTTGVFYPLTDEVVVSEVNRFFVWNATVALVLGGDHELMMRLRNATLNDVWRVRMYLVGVPYGQTFCV